MGELRKDYILDRYVIIANNRAKRPLEFISKSNMEKVEVCQFCLGNEKLTPPEIIRYPETGDWEIRVFPNKFPAATPEGNAEIRTDNYYYTFSDSYGYHEVIVETANHDKTLADLNEEKISQILKIFKQRIEVNMNCPHIKYVSVFKNHGKNAGTSIQHTHTQLIANNIIPKIITDKESAVKKFAVCPYCSILNMEKDSHRRCYENKSFIAFTPYASRFPFEIWIFPRRHIVNMTEFNGEEYVYLAEILKKILIKLKQLNADYNFFLQYGIENLHFHIEICPRLTKWAGFEIATETIINTMTPETAAEFYRE